MTPVDAEHNQLGHHTALYPAPPAPARRAGPVGSLARKTPLDGADGGLNGTDNQHGNEYPHAGFSHILGNRAGAAVQTQANAPPADIAMRRTGRGEWRLSAGVRKSGGR